MRLFKLFILWFAKHSGAFWLAQKLTADQLRILCYHGVWVGDRPRMGEKLFMEPETFRQRLLLLKQAGYRVVSLGQGVEELKKGKLAPKSVVITIDDGWVSTRSHMLPSLREAGFPSTLYLTSYYVEKAAPVLNVLVRFVLTRTDRGAEAQLDAIRSVIAEAQASGFASEIDLEVLENASYDQGKRAFADLLEYLPGVPLRLQHVNRLAELLDVDVRPAVRGRWFDLMTPEEVRETAAAGVDIQLHTHRHRFKDVRRMQSHQEIVENRASIASFLQASPDGLVHFCYPSGGFNEEQWPVLAALGVETATTVEEGLNAASTARYGLKRFLDGENVTALEFESYLSGFSEVLAQLKGLLRGRGVARPAAASVWALNSTAVLPVGSEDQKQAA